VTDDAQLLAGVRERGQELAGELEQLPHVISVRGRGLMLACELDLPAPAVARRALLSERLIVNATGAATLRLLPPLTISRENVNDAARRLAAALTATAAE
jgi:acetylornithine/N-succinyldiaminopimelate aminotransferase